MPAPTLELEQAVHRLGGNRALYARLLRDFAAQHPSATAPVRQALAMQDSALAHRLLHTYKGLTASLGAPALSECAQAALRLLRDYGDGPTLPAQLSHTLHQLDTLHPPTLNALLQASAAWQSSTTTTTTTTTTTPNTAALTPLDWAQALHHLQALVQAHDMQALATFAALPPALLRQAPAPVLEQALQALDFAQAQHQLTLWIKDLSPP